jgi:hypothetical protein
MNERLPEAVLAFFSMAHASRRRHHAAYFEQADDSMYMLGEPKSRPQFRNWFTFTILMGIILALVLVALGNWIF